MSLVAKLAEFDEIAPRIGSSDLRLFDVRWYLDGRDGYQAFLDAHVKSAMHIDVETCLCDESISDPRQGRHPLPNPNSFESILSSLGATRDCQLVFYDDQAGSVAARAWWMASALGYDAALLNGGLASVPKELLESGTSSHIPLPRLPVNSKASSWNPELVISENELKTRMADDTVMLLDARSKERYLGINESIDPRAGHIPSAISSFWRLNIDRKNRFKHPNEITRNFARIGIHRSTDKEIVSSCGSGITACHNIFSLLYALDLTARLFPASFSGWCQSQKNAVDK